MEKQVRAPGVASGPVATVGKELEGGDPYELVGVRFPVPSGVDADREVVRCFVEDYALMGWTPERIRDLFRTDFYRGAHDIVHRRGIDLVEEQIARTFGLSGGEG